MANLDSRVGGNRLDQRLGNTLPENQAMLAATQAQETPSGLDFLLQPENLVKLGLATAGALTGNRDLQAASLGLGLGTLQGAGQQAQAAYAEQQKRIDQLVGMVEKQQQRLTTLLQTQPGLFLDEKGEELPGASPEQLAVATGLGVQMSPAALNARARQSELEARQWKIHGALFEQALASRNETAAAQALQSMYAASGIDVTLDEARKDITMPLDLVPGVLAQRASVMSVAENMKWSNQTGRPWWDPEAPPLAPPVGDFNIKDQNDLLAMEGLGVIAREMSRLRESDDEAQQALYNEILNDPMKATDLINNDNTNNPVGVVAALEKVYPTFRLDEELFKNSLDQLQSVLLDPNSLQAIVTVAMSQGLTRSQAIGQVIADIMRQTDTAKTREAIERQIRREIARPIEDLEAELGGE